MRIKLPPKRPLCMGNNVNGALKSENIILLGIYILIFEFDKQIKRNWVRPEESMPGQI